MRHKNPNFFEIGPQSTSGRFLRMFWQPICLAERVRSGKAIPIHILGESFTLYRGQSGEPHLVAQRCAHRGLILSVGRVEGDCIRCFYHGWKYDAGGQCVEQPAEKRDFAAQVKIASYPTRDFRGLVFAYLGKGEPPPFPSLDAFEQDAYYEARAAHRNCGYFNQLENSVDEVHFNFVHRRSAFADAGLNSAIPEILCEETSYGIKRIGKRGNVTRISHILMPNCMFSMVFDHAKGWAEHLAWRVPVDETSHVSFMIDCIHKSGADLNEYKRKRAEQKAELQALEPAPSIVEKIIRGELHIDEISDRPDLLSIQDLVALAGQDERRDRNVDVLSASDLQVALLRRIWARELKAIETGGKLTAWRIPKDLTATTGVE